MAGADLYADNAFRVLGVATSASSRDVRRRAEALRLRVELDGDQAQAARIRAADAALQDPLRRFHQELYWLHLAPDVIPPGVWKELLSLSADGLAFSSAVVSLSALAAGGSDEGLHDLAVLWHARALESPEVDVEALRTGIQLWREVWASEAFWLRMRLRSGALADPRVTVATAEELRGDLPACVLVPSAKAVERLSDLGQDTRARECLVSILESDFPAAAVRQARSQATAGLRSQIRGDMAALGEVLHSDVPRLQGETFSSRAQKGARLRELLCDLWNRAERDLVPQVGRLRLIDAGDQYAYGARQRWRTNAAGSPGTTYELSTEVQVVADDAAELLASLGVRLHNDAGDSEAGLKPLLAAVKLAGSESVRQRAELNHQRLHFQVVLKQALSHAEGQRWEQGARLAWEAKSLAPTASEREEAQALETACLNAQLAGAARSRATRNSWIGIGVVVALIGACSLLSPPKPPPSPKPVATRAPVAPPKAPAVVPIPTATPIGRQELTRRSEDLRVEIETGRGSLPSKRSALDDMERRLREMQRQYPSGAPPNVVAEYERLRAQFNGEVGAYKRDQDALNSKVDEYNVLLARIRALR